MTSDERLMMLNLHDVVCAARARHFYLTQEVQVVDTTKDERRVIARFVAYLYISYIGR